MQNILLTEAFVAKLADVGLAKFFEIDSNRSMSTISHFTWQYSAPEVLGGGKCVWLRKAVLCQTVLLCFMVFREFMVYDYAMLRIYVLFYASIYYRGL